MHTISAETDVGNVAEVHFVCIPKEGTSAKTVMELAFVNTIHTNPNVQNAEVGLCVNPDNHRTTHNVEYQGTEN